MSRYLKNNLKRSACEANRLKSRKSVLQEQLQSDVSALRNELDQARRDRDSAQSTETSLREEIVGLQAKLEKGRANVDV